MAAAPGHKTKEASKAKLFYSRVRSTDDDTARRLCSLMQQLALASQMKSSLDWELGTQRPRFVRCLEGTLGVA